MQALPETKRLFLREWTMQDLDAWAAILSDAEVMRYYPKPFDRQNVQDWIAWNLENYRTDGFGLWAVHLRATGELLGDCGITMQQIHGSVCRRLGFIEEIRLGAGIRHRGSKSLLGVGHAADGFSSVLLLPEEHEFALTASCRETGNDLAGNRYRPCECVYQHVCNHKNGIFCRNTKRPAVITQQGVV